MMRRLTSPSTVWMLIGLVAGLSVVVFLQARPLQATSTDHHEEFAIATGHLQPGLEAVYVLDFKAGKLLGTVMNRQAGQFQQFYERSLSEDFALNARQKPKFIMVTGDLEVSRSQVPIHSVLYVAELNSGRLGAYFMPFRGETQKGTTSEQLQLMHMVPFRQTTSLRQ